MAAPYNGENYQWGQQSQSQSSFNFDVPEFGQELNFQNFDNSQTTTLPPDYNSVPNYSTNSFYDPNAYTSNIYSNEKGFNSGVGGGSEFDDEPPLLEELGINPNHIIQKTLSVLNPFRETDHTILQDTDMAGPLAFCLALGGFLLLSGKVTFSYIYGIGVMGWISFYCLLSLMATQGHVTFGTVGSILGYCLLPMVIVSGINVLITVQGTIGTILAGICIFWSSLSASKLFVTAYSMEHQRMLVAYPCILLYGVFALIIIF